MLSGDPLQVVLVSRTSLVRDSDLYLLAKALEISGQHCALSWGLPAPAVDVVARTSKVPPGAMPIFFVDGHGIKDSGSAYHYFDPLKGKPAARVFVGKATGFNSGTSSVAELASHELVEAIVDPLLDYWKPHPLLSRAGVEIAVEIADPVQTHYAVEVGTTTWRMANFVRPSYFREDLGADPELQAIYWRNGGRYDWAGELTTPGSIGPHGYNTLREVRPAGGYRVWLENARTIPPEFTAAQVVSKSHPLSRTKLRGVVLG